MFTAFQISEDDIESVLRERAARHGHQHVDFEARAANLMEDLDHGHIERCALKAGVELEQQTVAAHAEIGRQLDEMGVMTAESAAQSQAECVVYVTMRVAYKHEPGAQQELPGLLHNGLHRAIGAGLLTGGQHWEVESHGTDVCHVSPEGEALDEEQVAGWIADRIESGNLRLEDIPRMMARYALTNAAQMRNELAERIAA